MRFPWPLYLCCSMLMASACGKKEDAGIPSGVRITFKNDSGYTWADDSVAQNDTVRISAIISRGNDPLERFYLSLRFDGGPDTGVDTVQVDTDPFVYDLVHVTRGQPGTERLTFAVDEPDGDLTLRRLTLTVQ